MMVKQLRELLALVPGDTPVRVKVHTHNGGRSVNTVRLETQGMENNLPDGEYLIIRTF